MLVNRILKHGKKSLAYQIIYRALKNIQQNTKTNPLFVLRQAIRGVTPDIAVKARRVGGSTHQVPIEIGSTKGKALVIHWLLGASRKRPGRNMAFKLSSELVDAAKGSGDAIRKKEETHRMAEANRAFAHFHVSKTQIGEEYGPWVPFIGTMFLFIFVSNWSGALLPWKIIQLPHGELVAPTNDINTTVALALLTKYIQPTPILLPINILEDFTKPLSLSFRLFGNILADELVVVVLVSLVPSVVPIETPHNFHDGSYPIDVVFMHVRNANHSIHCYGNDNEKQEMLFLEIWTNGSLTPKEALHEASHNLIDLFIPFLHAEEENLHLENNQHNSSIHTLLDLLNNSREDLMKIEHFRIEDVKQILGILEKKVEKHFEIDLPKF
ncbi:hypothetical protein GQ457_11G033110 [Hibiscus cannabinus]